LCVTTISAPQAKASSKIWSSPGYVDALLARFVWLTVNRPVWRKRRKIGQGLYSYNHEHHVIFFRESHDTMEIVRVLDARMDLGTHLVEGIDKQP